VFLLGSKSEYSVAGTSKSLVTVTKREKRTDPAEIGWNFDEKNFYLCKCFSLVFVITIWYRAMEHDVKISFGSIFRTRMNCHQ